MRGNSGKTNSRRYSDGQRIDRFKTQRKKPGLVFKIDFLKAFDTVSWSFILNLLKAHGFGKKWCNWVKTIWETARFSILIKGSAEDFFYGSRGLRQGDPLSPLIFSLVASSLSRCLVKAQEEQLLEGFSVKEGSIEVPVLQYANDTLILNADTRMAENLRVLLVWFEAATGLQMNTAKTKIYKLNNVREWDEILGRWNCIEGLFPDTYLGLPLVSGFKSKLAWQLVIENFRSRLALWKKSYISKAGRLVLVKSTLASLPVFWMTLMVVPSSAIDELEKVVRNFLWGSTEVKRISICSRGTKSAYLSIGVD